jgi:malonyl-CoA/methylmalonyl-CoA synthetase
VDAAPAIRPWSDHLPSSAGFDPTGGVRPATVPAAFERAWSAAPEAPVLRVVGDPEGERWVGAGELAERSLQAAGRLSRLGLGSGSRLLWSPERSLRAVVSHLGALRAGATVVPVNPSASSRELRHLVGDASPDAAVVGAAGASAVCDSGVALVLDHELRPAAGAPRSRPAAAGSAPGGHLPPPGAVAGPALVGYTSGTTGTPKGALLTQANLLANSLALAAAWRMSPEDRLLHALPLFHGHGLCAALYTSLLVGGSVVVLPGFEVAALCDAMAAHDASLFFGVPTMFHRIATAGRAGELASLRLAVSGSAPLPAELHRRMAAEGTVVLERYGMTETGLTLSNPVEGERRAGTVGFPLPGVEVQVDEGGQLLVRGPQVFSGYLGRPAQDAEAFADGWFRTGDLVECCDGYVRIVGRTSDVVISGGFNVYPAEVEDVLLRHPAVAEVAVAGTASPEWGEVVTAWVVPADTGLFDVDSLLAFAAGELAPYKRPRVVRVVDSLPRNALGKVVRSELA